MIIHRTAPWIGALVVLTLSAPPLLADPARQLVPFPEDAEPRPATTAPARPRPPQSDFKPRFRAPAVKATPAEARQVDHVEPAVAPQAGTNPAAAATPTAPASAPDGTPDGGMPSLLPAESAPGAGTTSMRGRQALDLAYSKSKTAATLEDYSEVVDLCERAKQDGLTPKLDEYARQLTGWALNRRGEVHAQADRPEEALADFEAAVAGGGAWRAVHNRGVAYAAAGRTDEAMADLDETIRLSPRYAPAFFNRGELRSKLGDYVGAIDDYTAALKLGPREAPTYLGRGHAYYRTQRFGDALRDYGEAIRLDPQNADARINRGDTYCDVGKYGEAAKDYREAVRLAPKNGRAYQAVAWLMATCPDGHYQDAKLAVDAAQRAIELDGATYRNLSTLAAAQASAELFDEAEETQEQAIAAAEKKDVVTAEKMLSLYQRQIPFRDRPFTAFKTPEEMTDREVRQASAEDAGQQPQGRRAWFESADERAAERPQPGLRTTTRQLPDPSQAPGMFPDTRGRRDNRQPARPPKARLFAPRGKI